MHLGSERQQKRVWKGSMVKIKWCTKLSYEARPIIWVTFLSQINNKVIGEVLIHAINIKKNFLVGKCLTSRIFPVYALVLILTIIIISVMQCHDNFQSILSDSSRRAGCVWSADVFSRAVLWRKGVGVNW